MTGVSERSAAMSPSTHEKLAETCRGNHAIFATSRSSSMQDAAPSEAPHTSKAGCPSGTESRPTTRGRCSCGSSPHYQTCGAARQDKRSNQARLGSVQFWGCQRKTHRLQPKHMRKSLGADLKKRYEMVVRRSTQLILWYAIL